MTQEIMKTTSVWVIFPFQIKIQTTPLHDNNIGLFFKIVIHSLLPLRHWANVGIDLLGLKNITSSLQYISA